MSKMRLLAMSGATLACALGIGFVMQRGQSAPHPVARTEPAPVEHAALASLEMPDIDDGARLDLQKITLTSATSATSAQPDMSVPGQRPTFLSDLGDGSRDRLDGAVLPATPSDPDMPRLGCDVTARAAAGPMATVDLSVSAPCMGNERVTVHHNGMIFTAVTDQGGQLTLSVPALAERAVFVAAFANGKGAVATTRVADLDDYDRVVLQWSGHSGFQIHAREFGAGYGEAGHVWSGAATGESADGEKAAGTVIRLGDSSALSPQIAEVYSFPSGTSDRSGTVALSVEAEVTDLNCGRDVSAQLLERHEDGTLRTRDLTLSVPNCTAVGDFLVLNNLLDDLKIAAK